MIRFFVMVICVLVVAGAPQSFHKSRRPIPIFRESTSGLQLPNNATAIRENIVDTFSCENRIYGYYADIDNECQVFHICMPQNRGSIRWSFICPSETVFNQVTFVCTWTEESIPCTDSEQYYTLNEEFGKDESTERPQNSEDVTFNPNDYSPDTNEVPVTPFYGNSRGRGKNQRTGKNNDAPENPELIGIKEQ